MRFIIAGLLIAFITQPVFASEEIDYNDSANHQVRRTVYGNKGATSRNSESSFFNSRDHELNVAVDGGYRLSSLRWNIASDLTGTATPNVISELKWTNISGYQVEPKIEYTKKGGTLKGLNLQISANKSISFAGDNQDSDYNGNNRTAEYSRSNNSSDAGHAEGFSASIGYAFDFSKNRGETLARFTTLVGYAKQQQKFVMRDGFQTIPANGSFANLRSSYDMDLSMPFVGAELSGNFSKESSFKLSGKYYMGTYDGSGNWNLRSDFKHPKSFAQEADGAGFSFGAQYGWEFYPKTQFTLSGKYNYFKTDAGTTTFYMVDNTTPVQRLNEAMYISQEYMAGINYRF